MERISNKHILNEMICRHVKNANVIQLKCDAPYDVIKHIHYIMWINNLSSIFIDMLNILRGTNVISRRVRRDEGRRAMYIFIIFCPTKAHGSRFLIF